MNLDIKTSTHAARKCGGNNDMNSAYTQVPFTNMK